MEAAEAAEAVAEAEAAASDIADKNFGRICMKAEELLFEAAKAREFSYAPYSGFRVGAALLGASGKVYRGCNIENAAYTPTNCAERTAFFKAVSEGERDFIAIAIVGGKSDDISVPVYPCGVCRQVMAEFCDADSFVIYTKDGDGFRQNLLRELLPCSFTPKSLE